jgi:NADH-quinone oxidoreductase subunit L
MEANLHSLLLNLAFLTLLLPLASCLLLFFFGRNLPHQGNWLAVGFTALSFILSIVLFMQIWPDHLIRARWQWFKVSHHTFTVGLFLDRLSVLMLVLVTFISSLVQVYSMVYMRNDLRYRTYFAYLGLFTFAMLGVVLADSLFVLFFFWELVGLSSYLLIGFWREQGNAAVASRNAFLINRIGDTGFLLSIILIYLLYGSSDLFFLTNEAVFPMDTTWTFVVGLGLFCGCVGKSAQFPLQVWLPGAMAGPTPVSALIHAATMVAAGVFLLVRMYPLLDTQVLMLVAVVGTITAFMGGIAAIFQTDIKKLLAFSTVSQLGYMVMGIGVGVPQAALFHLLTHAFFKAGLFLSAGAVIHALHEAAHRTHTHFDAQDMRLMGGLRKQMPITFVCFLACGLALAGLPLFSGFLSKDAILAGALSWADEQTNGIAFIIPVIGFLTAFVTALYVGRQLLLIFFGSFRMQTATSAAQHILASIQEVPFAMKLPLVLLAAGSFFVFFSFNPLDGAQGWFGKVFAWHSIHTQTNWHGITLLLSIAASTSGLLLSYIFISRTKVAVPVFIRQLSLQNWYMDWVYQHVVFGSGKLSVQIARWVDRRIVDRLVNFLGLFTVVFSHVLSWIDRMAVDGVVNLGVYVAGRVGLLTRSPQNGKVQSYIVTAVAGLILLFVWVILAAF